MKKILAVQIILFFTACGDRSDKNNLSAGNNNKPEIKLIVKPPTIYTDTLKIESKAAIFYYPDSLQLKKLRAESDTARFDANMHEYEYLFKYVHNALNRNWSSIHVAEAKTVRYLLFTKTDRSKSIIDLNTKNDPYGLIVFDPNKEPTQLELSNAGTEISFYFLPKGPQKEK